MNEINKIVEVVNRSVDNQIALLTLETKQTDDPYEVTANKRKIHHLLDRKYAFKWMSEFKTKYHLTITFSINLNEYAAEGYVNSLLKMIQNEYFGSNKKKAFFDGLVIKERKENHEIHYHILISHNSIFNSKRNRGKDFEDVINDKCNRIIQKYRGKNGEERGVHPIDPKHGCYLQDYYSDNLEEYLTKTLENYRLDFDFIDPLSYDGFSVVEKSSKASSARRSNYDKSQDGICRIYRFNDTGGNAQAA